MLSTQRPVSAPSGDWRRGPHRDSVHFDLGQDTSAPLPRRNHDHRNEALQSEAYPASSSFASGSFGADQPIQRSLTTNEPPRQNSPLLHTSQVASGHDDPWERQTLLTLGQSKSEPSGNRLIQWY